MVQKVLITPTLLKLIVSHDEGCDVEVNIQGNTGNHMKFVESDVLWLNHVSFQLVGTLPPCGMVFETII